MSYKISIQFLDLRIKIDLTKKNNTGGLDLPYSRITSEVCLIVFTHPFK